MPKRRDPRTGQLIEIDALPEDLVQVEEVEANTITVTTSPTFIEAPVGAYNIIIRHTTPGAIVWIGENDSISVGGGDVFPLLEGDTCNKILDDSDDNNIYAIVESGTVDVYVISETRT